MASDSSNPLINLGNLGDLTKPADTLVKKVSNAVGGLFAPWQIKRVAKAEAEAELIKAQSEIQITELHRRALHRFVEEEAQRQQNMEDITVRALPQLDENAKPDSIENDWIVNFFDKCRIVSDNEMQELWSRILAGEANSPGTYSKRTVNFLSDLDKTDADLFTKLCGFVWVIGEMIPLVFDERAQIYNRHGINFDSLNHLDSIGLIQYGGVTSMVAKLLEKRFTVSYYGKQLTLDMSQGSDDDLDIGKAIFTRVGQELTPICRSKLVEGFWEYVKEQWSQYLPKPEKE